jgi:hypothetical protein
VSTAFLSTLGVVAQPASNVKIPKNKMIEPILQRFTFSIFSSLKIISRFAWVVNLIYQEIAFNPKNFSL